MKNPVKAIWTRLVAVSPPVWRKLGVSFNMASGVLVGANALYPLSHFMMSAAALFIIGGLLCCLPQEPPS